MLIIHDPIRHFPNRTVAKTLVPQVRAGGIIQQEPTRVTPRLEASARKEVHPSVARCTASVVVCRALSVGYLKGLAPSQVTGDLIRSCFQYRSYFDGGSCSKSLSCARCSPRCAIR